jgi:DNA-directed RNA polymerase subunit M/transcription elongation factor TFIIS
VRAQDHTVQKRTAEVAIVPVWEVPGNLPAIFLMLSDSPSMMKEMEDFRVRRGMGLKDKVRDPEFHPAIDLASLIRADMLNSKTMQPSDIDLGKVICPKCGSRTSGYFLDQVSGSYNFFCSCCRHEWEC